MSEIGQINTRIWLRDVMQIVCRATVEAAETARRCFLVLCGETPERRFEDAFSDGRSYERPFAIEEGRRQVLDELREFLDAKSRGEC